MTITGRTRKILWALSGNQCAMCPQRLIEDATADDREAVVGRECHIISRKGRGPRNDPDYPDSEIDTVSNLLLLCPTHHAIVDAQDSTYTTEQLRRLKQEHESRVRARMGQDGIAEQIRFIRLDSEIPQRLDRISSGKQLRGMVESYHALAYDYPEIQSDTDAELFGGFGQEINDWNMLLTDGEVRHRVAAELALHESLQRLVDHDCAVFGAMERQRVEGGVMLPSDWYVAHITVVRIDDKRIVWRDQEKTPDS